MGLQNAIKKNVSAVYEYKVIVELFICLNISLSSYVVCGAEGKHGQLG